MENFVRIIEGCLVYRLLSIVSSIVGVMAGLFAIIGVLIVRFKFVWRYSSLPKLKRSDDQPIVLGVQHCRSPSEHEIKGKQVVATGIIMALDSHSNSFTLYGFPFHVRAAIICELAADERARLDSLDLISGKCSRASETF